MKKKKIYNIALIGLGNIGSYLYTFLNLVKYGEAIYLGLNEEFQLGEFSIGFTQQTGSVNSFSLNNFGIFFS